MIHRNIQTLAAISTTVKMLIGAASIEGNKITPEKDLKLSHFITELWGLADYGDGGLLAIKMKRVLNTSGFSVSTTDKSKAQLAFNFTCHKTIENQGDPPYEVYLLTPNSTYGSVRLYQPLNFYCCRSVPLCILDLFISTFKFLLL